MTTVQLDLLMIALTLWPCVVILKRLGLKPRMSALLLLSLIIPLLGHMLVALYAATAKWPNFAPIVKPAKRVKL